MRTTKLMIPVLALISGCSHPNPLVGTWAGDQSPRPGVVVKTTWTFTNEGRNRTTLQALGGYFRGRTFGSDGTYTADGSTMTQTIDSMSEPGRIRTIPRPVTSTYHYTLTGNTLTISGGGLPATLVLTRQSS